MNSYLSLKNSDALLSTQEATNYLGISKSTIYRYCQCGNIPYIKKSFGYRFRRPDLDKWLDQDKRKARLTENILKNALTNWPPVVIDKTKGGTSKLAKKGQTCFNCGFGSVYFRKTKDGIIRWYIYYHDSKGKRVRKVAKAAESREEAFIALKDAVIKEHFKKQDLKQRQDITFKDFAEIYLKNYSMVKKRSWKSSDKVYLNANLIPYFGTYELTKIDTLLIEQFITKRLEDGVKKSTINRYLACLRKMFNKAVDWNYIAVSPFRGIKLFSEREFKRDRVLSHEEEKRLYQVAAPHLKPILVCALMTAMRTSEILGLRWENVNLERRQIIIKAESCKSGKPRIIPINSTLFAELGKLKNMNNGVSRHVFLYRDTKTGKLRPVKSVRKAFNMACKRGNIKDLKFHDLRHTASTRLIDKGANPVAVQRILGHANLKTTEIYLHSSFEQTKEVMELLAEDLAGRAEKWGFLTHHRHTEKGIPLEKLPTYLFSVN